MTDQGAVFWLTALGTFVAGFLTANFFIKPKTLVQVAASSQPVLAANPPPPVKPAVVDDSSDDEDDDDDGPAYKMVRHKLCFDKSS